MSEKYEEAITQAIADEAKKEGVTTVVVLDKWKIVKALAAANPEDFPDMVKVVRCKDCQHYYNGVCTNTGLAGTIIFMNPFDYCSYGERADELDFCGKKGE